MPPSGRSAEGVPALPPARQRPSRAGRTTANLVRRREPEVAPQRMRYHPAARVLAKMAEPVRAPRARAAAPHGPAAAHKARALLPAAPECQAAAPEVARALCAAA